MLKTFDKAVRFLESYIPEPSKKHPGKLGLERMKYLVSLLGNPQISYPTIHVGGTSGKGSTATMIAYLLATKYKVGLHTSPHLEKVTERMKIIKNIKYQRSNIKNTYKKLNINRDNIGERELIDLINEVLPVIKKVEKSKYGRPSYFEIVAAMAFLYFAKKKVDIAVIEAGMGGRYDGTNVVRPLVSVLTNVGLDHTEVLGETVEEIAQDKAGIIKKNIMVVSGASQTSVIKIVKGKCRKERAKLSLLTSALLAPSPRRSQSRCFDTPSRLRRDFRGGFKADVFSEFGYQLKKLSSKGCVFDYFGENTYRDLKLSLLGEHQIQNACLAIRTIEQLIRIKNQESRIKNINEREVRIALSSLFIPGRLEIVSKRPLVILDGAHNKDKMKALVEAIKKIFPKKKVTAVVAIKKGKDIKGMLSYLLPICSKVIFTKFKLTTDLGDTYSYEPEELVELGLNSLCFYRIIENPQKAVAEAIKKTKKDDLILVTGSLYLIGEIRKFLIFKQIDN